jgi:hypothetical protein
LLLRAFPTAGFEREVQFRGASDISGFGGLGVCSGVTQPVAA